MKICAGVSLTKRHKIHLPDLSGILHNRLVHCYLNFHPIIHAFQVFLYSISPCACINLYGGEISAMKLNIFYQLAILAIAMH